MFKLKEKNLQQPLTLGNFIEFTDFVADNVAMKSDIIGLDSRIGGLEKKMTQMEIRLDSRIDRVETRLEGKITDFRDEILTSYDKIAKKLDILLTENAVKVGRDDEQDQEIADTKHRVRTIEHRVGLEPIAP